MLAEQHQWTSVDITLKMGGICFPASQNDSSR